LSASGKDPIPTYACHLYNMTHPPNTTGKSGTVPQGRGHPTYPPYKPDIAAAPPYKQGIPTPLHIYNHRDKHNQKVIA